MNVDQYLEEIREMEDYAKNGLLATILAFMEDRQKSGKPVYPSHILELYQEEKERSK